MAGPGRYLRGLAGLFRRVQLVICLTVVASLAMGLSPLWGADGEGTPLALGFIRLDGTTEITEFTSDEYVPETVLEETLYGVPAEPRGHQLVRLTNVERVKKGFWPLKAAPELMEAAQYHSNWMANHNCLAHVCPNEPDWVKRIVNAGYVNYEILAENVAGGYMSAQEAVDGWMKSPSHQANMLNPAFREAGGGYAYSASSKYYHYWTIDFGTRRDAQGNPVFPVVINNEGWFSEDLNVQLYVYGQGWAQEMRFRNEGGTWCSWMAYQPTMAWTLSGANGTPAVVYAQVKNGSTILESSDSIHINPPPQVSPDQVVFLSVKGSGTTIPAQYGINIETSGSWSASADKTWIRLSDYSGSGDATVDVHLEGFPSSPGTYTGTITIVAFGIPVEVDVTLAVTGEPLQQNHVPVSTKEQGA